MLELIGQEVIGQRYDFANRFRAATPFPHLVIDGFFESAFCERLIRAFPPFDRGCNRNEFGLPGRKSTFESLRALGEDYSRADDLFRSSEFGSLVSDVTGIPNLLYDPEYIGGGTHENLSGQDLDPHVDFNYHPRRGWHRRLNLIVYLNPEWHDDWGGSLELHEDPWLPPDKNRITRVLPVANRAILFETSERSWHGFEAIRPPRGRPDMSRKSLAIYMYTIDRPASETAPSHSTVYVERPLPFVLQPGWALSYKQLSRVTGLLQRRMMHIERLEKREREFTEQLVSLVGQRLGSGAPLEAQEIELLGEIFRREDALLRTFYDREKEFSRDVDRLQSAIGTQPRYGLPIFGPFKLAREPVGFTKEDHWAAPVVGLEIIAREPVGGLAIHGVVPELIPEGQSLTCTVAGFEHRVSLARGPFCWRIPVSLGAKETLSVTLRASISICPARDIAGATDPRNLAYHLMAIELV